MRRSGSVLSAFGLAAAACTLLTPLDGDDEAPPSGAGETSVVSVDGQALGTFETPVMILPGAARGLGAPQRVRPPEARPLPLRRRDHARRVT